MNSTREEESFRKIDYSDLTPLLVFTDIDISRLKNDERIVIDQRIMFECLERKQYFLSNFNKQILRLQLQISEKSRKSVVRILFLIPYAENQDNFIKEFEILFRNFHQIFMDAEIFLCLSKHEYFDKFDKLLHEFPIAFHLNDIGEENFTFKEINDFLDSRMLRKQVQLNYARCHHSLLIFLEKRCKDLDEFCIIGDNFFINHKSLKLNFIRNSHDNTYSMYDNRYPTELLLKLTNDHLLGFYNPFILFEIIYYLQCLKNLTKTNVYIDRNRITYDGAGSDETNFLKDFTKIIEKCRIFLKSHSKKFKIQLGINNLLILNRKLKISCSVMSFLLKNDATEPLTDLVYFYFKCFSIAPICCRMQSLAPEAEVFDFEKFTYSHINTHRSFYFSICRLLFPYVADVKEDLLKNTFLEVIPVTLIQRFQGKKLGEFVEMLEKLKRRSISVVPLPNGNFRIGEYFNVNAEMLCSIRDVEKIEDALFLLQNNVSFINVVNLENLINILDRTSNNLDSTMLLKAEDLEYSSLKYCEYKYVHFFCFETNRHSKYEVKNLPLCKICDINNDDTLLIFCNVRHQIMAVNTRFVNNLNSYSRIELICKVFSDAFRFTKTAFSYPTYQKLNEKFKKYGYFKDSHIINFLPREVASPARSFWIYKDRFLFNSTVLRNDAIRDMQFLIDYEKENGICLAFVNNRIVFLENMNMAIAELDPDYYKATADFCYYNEEKIVNFCEISYTYAALLSYLKLFFEITAFGCIKINNLVEIEPSVVSSSAQSGLFEGIALFCQAHPKLLPKDFLLARIPVDHEEKSILISIAKILNPLLTNVSESFFKNIHCIPPLITLSYAKEMEALLKQFREKRLRIRYNNKFLIEYFKFSGYNIEKLNPTLFLKLLPIIEKLNEDFDEIVIINDKAFSKFNYEKFENNIFEPEFFKKPGSDFLKCCEILNNGKCSVKILVNDFFLINKAITIFGKDLLKLTPANHKYFFEFVEIFSQLSKEMNTLFSDNWISLADGKLSDALTVQLAKNNRFRSFMIVDDDKNTYLKLAKIINIKLHEISDEQLLSYEWLELIPREFIMNSKNAEKLLKVLYHFNDRDIKITSNGNVDFSFIQVSVAQLLQLCSDSLFSIFLELVDKLCIKEHLTPICVFKKFFGSRDSLKTKMKLHCSGLFCATDVPETNVLPFLTTAHKQSLENAIIILKSELNLKNESSLSITINSGEQIMLGNFIWVFVKDILPIKDFLCDIVINYEKAFNTEDKDLMRSIHGLACKNSENKENAIMLAKAMNPNLENFPDEILCDESIRIMPTDLWKLCDEKSDNYAKAMEIFTLLKTKQIPWLIKLTGNIQIDSMITVNVSTLLKHYVKIDEILEKLNILCTKLFELRLCLLCLEEVRDGKERLTCEKIYSYSDIFKAKEIIEHHKQSCRIEPDGTLCINDSFYVEAKHVLDEVSEVSQIFFAINDIFPGYKFQYGTRKPIITSLLTTTDKQLFDYCYNMCELLQEKHLIEVKYVPQNNHFMFNEILLIHPRSFFHLQDMEKVIAVLRKYEHHKKKNSSFLELNGETNAETRKFCSELWKIFSNERIEFETVNRTCFTRLGEILLEHKEELKHIGNVGVAIHKNEKTYNGVDEIEVRGFKIFRDGVSTAFVNCEDGVLTFKYSPNNIIDALNFVNNLKIHECRNLFDFHSVVEIILTYKEFIKKKGLNVPPNFYCMSQQDQIFWWLEKVQEQQERNLKYKFSNTLKGLHHWFKHDKGFSSLYDYYSKMNEFFPNAINILSLDTQNGNFINRRYHDSQYFGVYMIALAGSGKTDCVATFYARRPDDLKKSLRTIMYEKVVKEVPCTKDLTQIRKINEFTEFLVIIDKTINSYVSENEVRLIDNIRISVQDKIDFASLQTYFSRFRKTEKVKKVLLFLSSIKENNKKKKSQENVRKLPSINFKEARKQDGKNKTIKVKTFETPTQRNKELLSQKKLEDISLERTIHNDIAKSSNKEKVTTTSFTNSLMVGKANDKKDTDVEQKETCLLEEVKSLQKMIGTKLNNPMVILCCPFNVANNFVEVCNTLACDRFVVVPFTEELLTNHNAADFKRFLESQF